VSTDRGSRPRAVLPDPATFRDEIGQRWHILLISKLPKKASRALEPGDERRWKIDSRDQNQ
jgi:hypothetical protein